MYIKKTFTGTNGVQRFHCVLFMPCDCHVIGGDDLVFPTEYPYGCLLGSVEVLDCVNQFEYKEKASTVKFKVKQANLLY